MTKIKSTLSQPERIILGAFDFFERRNSGKYLEEKLFIRLCLELRCPNEKIAKKVIAKLVRKKLLIKSLETRGLCYSKPEVTKN